MIDLTPEYKTSFSDLVSFKISTPKIKILCLSLWYPLTMSRYFEDAMRHRDDVELLTCGIYTGSWIPWKGGMNLPEKYAIPPDIPLPFRPDVGKVNYDLVKPHLPEGWKPDIVMCIDAGISWQYRPSEGMVVHIATDPHCINYDHQRTLTDKFFNMQAVYSKPGDIYLPYAYSPRHHYPMPEIQKDTDAVLVGLPYVHRQQWIDALRSRGVSVIFENGPAFDEYRELNNRARIGLNWSSLNDFNARAFELAAMKLCPVMNRVPDMQYFDFIQYCHIFDDLNGAIEKVMWCKENLDETLGRAAMAYQAVQGQTYDVRVEQILKECGFL